MDSHQGVRQYWEEVARKQAELWVQFASCGSHLQAGLAYEFLADLTRTKRYLAVKGLPKIVHKGDAQAVAVLATCLEHSEYTCAQAYAL